MRPGQLPRSEGLGLAKDGVVVVGVTQGPGGQPLVERLQVQTNPKPKKVVKKSRLQGNDPQQNDPLCAGW